MKNLYKIFMFLAVSMILYTACTPDEYELEAIDVSSDELVEGIAYTVEHDADNPNIVYLTSLMDSRYTALWNHPQGRSQESKVTLKIPFAGTYDVQFGVLTSGGYVYGDTVQFTIDDMYAGFIEDESWTLLAGGQGESKTWYLDLDADATTRYFGSPMWFFTDTYEWDNLHTASGDNYIDATSWDPTAAITPNLTENEATWYWKADYAGNSWMCEAADFGTMTFDLIGGANVTVNQAAYSADIGDQAGTYMLDVDAHTIAFTDVDPLHVTEREDGVQAATSFRILHLTENFLQILVVPEGVCFNYISEEYRENWVDDGVVEEPSLPDGWQDDVSQVVTTSIKWVLSEDTPFNWANLDGSLMNDWPDADSYADWTGFDSSVPASYANFSMEMNSETNEVTYTDLDGNATSGTYTLDEDGIYTFDGVTPNFEICGGWVYLTTTADNQWRILQLLYDGDNVSGMWVGVLSDDGTQYMCYLLEPEAGSSSGGDTELEGTELVFDNSKLDFGDLEGNGNLRLELYNDYGTTASDSPINREDLVFSNSIEITFTLGGITLVDGATGSYDTGFSLADGDWSPQYWGDGTQETVATVTGDGTYTVTYEPSSTSEGAVVFVIDIKGMATDISDLTTVTATIDKITMY